MEPRTIKSPLGWEHRHVIGVCSVGPVWLTAPISIYALPSIDIFAHSPVVSNCHSTLSPSLWLRTMRQRRVSMVIMEDNFVKEWPKITYNLLNQLWFQCCGGQESLRKLKSTFNCVNYWERCSHNSYNSVSSTKTSISKGDSIPSYLGEY